ncbi:MAG: PGPGW domain-containing protein [Rhodoblastus sp.]
MIPEWLKHPRWRWLRPPLGTILIILGCFGFLPVLGFWMIPLGLAVLALDFPVAERANRRLAEKWRVLAARYRVWRSRANRRRRT